MQLRTYAVWKIGEVNGRGWILKTSTRLLGEVFSRTAIKVSGQKAGWLRDYVPSVMDVSRSPERHYRG